MLVFYRSKSVSAAGDIVCPDAILHSALDVNADISISVRRKSRESKNETANV